MHCLRSKKLENISNTTKTLPFNLLILSVDNIVLGYSKGFPFCFCLNPVACRFCTKPKELTFKLEDHLIETMFLTKTVPGIWVTSLMRA